MISVPVMSAGIRSGVNWMRLKSSARMRDSVLTSSCLGQAGHADEDAVPSREDGDEQLLHDSFLADDNASDLIPHRVVVRVTQVEFQTGHVVLIGNTGDGRRNGGLDNRHRHKLSFSERYFLTQ